MDPIIHHKHEPYTAGGSVLKVLDLSAGESRAAGNREVSTLIYIDKGALEVSSATFEPTVKREGHMFIAPAKDSYFCRAIGSTRVYCFYFYPEEHPCYNFARKEFIDLLRDKPVRGINDLVAIEANWIFVEKLHKLGLKLDTIKDDYLYWRMEADSLMVLLLNLHPEEELARMFLTLIKTGSDFQTLVYRLYSHVHNANELIELSGIPAGTFRRKFMNTFGMSVGKWLAFKREENILNDIVHTDLPFKEIAKKYGLTVNYFFNYCQEHFQKTPMELREVRS